MNHKKIGIVTFHFSVNYGSALQCYALSKILSLHGYDPIVVDYRPNYHSVLYRTYTPFRDYREIRSGKNGVYLFAKNAARNVRGFFRCAQKKKNKRFDRFVRENLKLTQTYKHVKDIDNAYDTYISGSDQIWNYRCVKDAEFGGAYDKAYFLSFAQGKKKIAYAASAQHGEMRTDLDKDVLPLIQQYDSIATREAALTHTLHELGRADAVTVLDPTLLLDARHYQSVEAKVPCENEEYILVYNLPGTNSQMLKQLVEQLAAQTGCKIVDISPFPYADLPSRKMKTCGPAEFLAYIHHAKYVLTDSFHAVVYSLIYHKDFYCVLRAQNDERIQNILAMAGLTDHLVDSADAPLPADPIDFAAVDRNMHPAKEASIQFLLNAVEK